MPAWSLTISLGSGDEGQKRREAYEKSAARKGSTLSEWAKKSLDAASGIKIVKET